MKDITSSFKHLVLSGHTTPEIAESFGASNRTVSRWRKLLREGKPVIAQVNSTQGDASYTPPSNPNKVKLDYQKQQIACLKTIREQVKKQKVTKISPVKPSRKGNWANVLLTDWHSGKRIVDETGEETFNTQILEQRASRILSESLSLLDYHVKKTVPIVGINLLLGGDLVDGSGVYPGQELSQLISPPRQVIGAIKILRSYISQFLKRNLPVNIYAVKGNHGDIKSYGKVVDPTNNYDLMVYLLLEDWLNMTKQKKVFLKYAECTDYLNFQICGHKMHLRHRGKVQYETAAGKSKLLGWAQKHHFKTLITAHNHHWSIGEKNKIFHIRNGCLSGWDDLSERMAEDSDPTQLIWGTSEKRRISFLYPVDLR